MALLDVTPLRESYNFADGRSVESINLGGGKSRFSRRYYDPTVRMNVVFSFTPDGYDEWGTFYDTTMIHGSDLFTVNLVVDGASTTKHLARIIPGTVRLVGIRGQEFKVAAQLEVNPDIEFTDYIPPAGSERMRLPIFQSIRDGNLTQASKAGWGPDKSDTFVPVDFDTPATGTEWTAGSQYDVDDTTGEEGVFPVHSGASWCRLRYTNSAARTLAREMYPKDRFTIMTIWIRQGTYTVGRSGVLFSAPQQTGNQSTFQLDISEGSGLRFDARNGASRPSYQLREHTGSGNDYRGESHMFTVAIEPSSADGTADGTVTLFVDGVEVAEDTTWAEQNFIASANDERLGLGKRNQATLEDNADGNTQMLNNYYIPIASVPADWKNEIVLNNWNFWNTSEFNY